MHTEPKYIIPKSILPPKSVVANTKVEISNGAESNMQMGFGLIQNEDDSDIDFQSAEKVDPNILQAFANPVFKTNVTKFTPQLKRKNEKDQEGEGKSEPKLKHPKPNKLKFFK
jgi:hypothetical protein